MTTHHIVSDGWSMGILYRELGKLYAAFSHGGIAGLANLQVEYPDFVQWQRERVDGTNLEEQINYWKEQLSGAQATLDLPTDRPRSATQTYRGSTFSFDLCSETVSGLKRLAREKGATLHMVLVAGFQTLLYRYTGQEDILVGSPIAGRTRSDAEGLIGLFLNTQVIRGDLSGSPTVGELIRRVRNKALEAHQHQEVPFEKLVEALHPQRDLSRSPLFQVMFVLQNEPLEALKLTGLKLRPLPIHSGTSKFDLTISVEEKSDGLGGYVEFNSDLFDRETIIRLIGHYETVLRAMAADPEAKVNEKCCVRCEPIFLRCC